MEMLSKGTFVKILLFSLLAVVAQQFVQYVAFSGIFKNHYNHYPGQCKKVEGIQPGSENFHTLPNGLTFITSGFRQQTWGEGIAEHFRVNNAKGRIYLFDFKKSEHGAKELKISSTKQFSVDTFAPHGISVWEDKKSDRHIVFVVNHPMEEPVVDRIEKFVYISDKQELQHVASYSDPSMKVMNDVQATGENSFYFTNYQSFRAHLPVVAETILRLPLTNIVYFDGKVYNVVAEGLRSPNGIAMSNDQQYIYVAICLGGEINVYKRNKDNSLTLQQSYSLHTLPDNPLVDPKTGDVYAGCHPFPLKVNLVEPLKYSSPSQVLHLRVKSGNITSAQELLYDDGGLISASTSAMVYDRKLLVGSIFHNLILCDVNVPM